MAQRKKTGGRQKGVPNKLTSSAREAIAIAAEKLGGAKRLVEWAREEPANETAFWTKIYPRLVPVEMTGAQGGPVILEVRWKTEGE